MNSSITDANVARPEARRWIALVVLLAGTLLPPLDFFIVNVALPAIREDLRAAPGVSQLVVSVYATAYAVTLVLGGRLGDIWVASARSWRAWPALAWPPRCAALRPRPRCWWRAGCCKASRPR
ncbi:hypothetical protein [Pseudoxanthomonas winnipegensis]|uniref:hypothetical protein n=1 Tax=Pseudoxanthomonas winnipegensis TaxID=2480810 RepID=UPI001D195A82|nr:hypothetical protein [Pseudoxanthomonas winnipegensis]